MVHKTLSIQSHYIPGVPSNNFSDDDVKEKPNAPSFPLKVESVVQDQCFAGLLNAV